MTRGYRCPCCSAEFGPEAPSGLVSQGKLPMAMVCDSCKSLAETSAGTDEFKEQWTGRYYGVYAHDDTGNPVCLWRLKADAEEWLRRAVEAGEMDAESYAVLRTDLVASFWNSEDPDPKE